MTFSQKHTRVGTGLRPVREREPAPAASLRSPTDGTECRPYRRSAAPHR